MLIGKIIRISWLGDGWQLVIDGNRKFFTTYQAMNTWLVAILGKVRDQRKKKLLLDDLNKFLILEGNEDNF